MADGVIQYVLRMKDESSGGMKDVVVSAEEMKKQIALAGTSATDAEKRLRQMAATGDDAKMAALKMAELRAQVEKLVAATGNKQLGAEALAAVAKAMSDVQNAAGSGKLAQGALGPLAAEMGGVAAAAPKLTAAATQAAEATEIVGAAAGMGRMQILSLKYAAADAANSLIAGASPFMVLMQQGPQVVEAMTMMDGGMAAVGATLKATVLPALAAALPYLAGITIAAAAGGTAWAVWTNATMDAATEARDLRDAEASLESVTKANATAAEALRTAWKAFADIADDVKTQIDVINGKLTENQAAAERQVQAAQLAARETLLAEGQRVGALKMTIAANEAIYNSEEESAEARANASAKLKDLRPQLEEATAALNAHKAEVEATAEGIRTLAAYKDAEGESDRVLAEREERLRKAREALRKAEEEMNKARAAQRALAQQVTSAEAALTNIIRQQETPLDAANRKYQEAQEAIRAAIDAGVDYKLIVEAKSAAMKQYATDLKAAKDAAVNLTDAETSGAQRSRVEKAAYGANMAAGGPQAVMGAVSSAGPWGAIIGAIASTFNYSKDPKTGQVHDGIANLGDSFNNFTIGFNQAIGHLPQTLGANLGKWIETGTQSAIDMVPDFVAGLAESLPAILGGIVESIPKMTGKLLEATMIELPKAIIALVKTLFSAELWVGLWEGFKESMIEAWESLFGNAEATTSGSGAFNQGGMFDRMFVGKKEKARGEQSTFFNNGGLFDAIWGGVDENLWGLGFQKSGRRGFATGGWVDRTGLALVHQGEYITPASGSQSGTADARGMGPMRGRVSGRGGQIVIDLEDFARAYTSQASGRGIQWGG